MLPWCFSNKLYITSDSNNQSKLDTRSIIYIDGYLNGIFIVYYLVKKDHMGMVGMGDEDGRHLG
jgi:hypothetical protein